MTNLDDLLAELSRIHAEIAALEEGDFASRHRLLLRRDTVREEVAQHHQGYDESRPTEDLLAELEALRSQADSIEKDRIDVVKQHGGGSWGAAAGADGWGAVQLNQSIDEAQGLPRIRSRIGRLKGILSDRGVDS